MLLSIVFTWIAWDFDWSVGLFFAVLPYIPLFLVITVVLITHNDISNQVDVASKARTKLPAQGQPAPFISVAPQQPSQRGIEEFSPMNVSRFQATPGRSPPGAPPAIPIQQDTPVQPRHEQL